MENECTIAVVVPVKSIIFFFVYKLFYTFYLSIRQALGNNRYNLSHFMEFAIFEIKF